MSLLSPKFAGFKLITAFALSLALTGCGQPHETVLGTTPGTLQSVSVQELSRAANGKVTLQGEMVEKCPVAGCWFKLRDRTGIVRVDTKAAGFVVSDVPLHTKMTVSGTLMHGAETGVAATGIRY